MLHVNKLRPLLGPSTKDVLDVYVSPYDDRQMTYLLTFQHWKIDLHFVPIFV